MLIKERIREMNEADLSTEVLIPLLRAMGFRDVTYCHGGSAEQGKDITCWKSSELVHPGRSIARVWPAVDRKEARQ